MKLGPWEIAFILMIVVMVFGAGKLPDIGRQFGKGVRDFKKYSRGAGDEEIKASPGRADIRRSEIGDAEPRLEVPEAGLRALDVSAKGQA